MFCVSPERNAVSRFGGIGVARGGLVIAREVRDAHADRGCGHLRENRARMGLTSQRVRTARGGQVAGEQVRERQPWAGQRRSSC